MTVAIWILGSIRGTIYHKAAAHDRGREQRISGLRSGNCSCEGEPGPRGPGERFTGNLMFNRYRSYTALGTVIKLIIAITITGLLIELFRRWLEVAISLPHPATAFFATALLCVVSSFAIFHWVFKPLERAQQKRVLSETVQREHDRLQKYLDYAATIFVVIGGDQSISLINQKGCDVLGFVHSELVGRNWFDTVIPGRIREKVRADFIRLITGETGSVEYFENTVVTKNGDERTIAWHNAIMKDDRGNFVNALFSGDDITERKKYDLALNKAREHAENEKAKSEAIIAAIGDGITIQDTDFKILYQNDIIKDVLGEHIGEYCYEAYESNDQLCDGCAVALAFQDGKIHTVERSVPRDNVTRYIELTASPVRDAAGNIIAGIEFARDITERKQAQAKILRLNRVYSMLSAINKTIVRIRDRDTLFAEACRISVEQGLFRMAWVGLVDPATLTVNLVASCGSEEGYIEKALMIAREVTPVQGPVLKAYHEGKYFISDDIEYDAHMQPWREEALKRGYRSCGAFPLRVRGTIIGAITFYSTEAHFFDEAEVRLLDDLSNDLSFALEFIDKDRQHKLAEEQIAQSKQDWEDTFETITDMITIHDKDYNIIRANKAAQAILNLPLLSKNNAHCFEYYHGTACPPADCPSCESLATGKPTSFEVFEPHLKKFIEIRAIPRFDKNNQLIGLIHVVRDIGKRKKLELQLFQAQKMEAVGQLAGGVAHDFNNILTAILGDAYLLEMRMGENNPLTHYVEDIRTSSEKAVHLTQSLLAFSRKQLLNPKPIDLNSLIRKLHKLTARLIGEDIDYTTFLSDPELTVMADGGQIEQVLINLITNARDSMPRGGKLSITSKSALIDNAYIAAHGFGTSGNYALISVADSGSGMDSSVRERIFEPFFTTKEVGKGTGLGLSIVYGIIKQHNGFIDCVSEPNQGTTFNIYLPLVDHRLIENQPVRAAPGQGTEYILLAEDDKKVRDTTRNILEEFGYKAIEAVNGDDAVRKFIDNRDTIQLLIMDVIMPKKNGKEAYEEIKIIKPDVKVLFLSGYSNDIIHRKGIIDENLNFLAKPASPIKLLSKIRELLDK